MRLLISIFLLSNTFLFAFEIKEIKLNDENLYYYVIKSEQKESKKSLLFLHGSVSQYKNQDQSRTVPIDSLLELNTSFVSHFTKQGYTCYFPISHNDFNWLEVQGENFLNKIIELEKINRAELVLSGFSDGATGAYRYFYAKPENYKSLLVFNAFPQLNWYSEKVNHQQIQNKKVIFVSQDKDKTIPYEFSLLEYRRQKLVNQETYFLLREGKHEFSKYQNEDFMLITKMLESPFMLKKNSEEFTWIFPPIDGLILDNKLIEIYPFRKEIAKKYNIVIEEYMSQSESYSDFKKNLENQETIQFLPILISSKDLNAKKQFELEYVFKLATKENISATIFIDNYLIMKSWEE